MLDFEEELKHFKPALEVEDIEEAVYREDSSAARNTTQRNSVPRNTTPRNTTSRNTYE